MACTPMERKTTRDILPASWKGFASGISESSNTNENPKNRVDRIIEALWTILKGLSGLYITCRMCF